MQMIEIAMINHTNLLGKIILMNKVVEVVIFTFVNMMVSFPA